MIQNGLTVRGLSLLFLTALGTELFATPLAEDWTELEESAFAVLCERLEGVPYPLTCKVRLMKGKLEWFVETTKDGSRLAPHPTSLLGKTGIVFFLDPFRNLYSMYGVAVDFAGRSALYHINVAEYLRRLQCPTTVKREVEGSDVRLTIQLPLKRLNIRPGRGDIWGMSLVGYLLGEDGKPREFWRRGDAGAFCWSLRTRIPLPRGFRLFRVGRMPGMISLTRGILERMEVFAQNRFSWTWLEPEASGRGTFTVEAVLQSEDHQVLSVRSFQYTFNEPAALNFAYDVPANTVALSFSISDEEGREIYSSQYPVYPNMPNRFPSRRDHFDKSSLERVPPDTRLKGDVQLTWTHGLRPAIMKVKAQQNAYPYNQKEWLKYLKRTGQAVIIPYPNYWGGRERIIEWAEAIRETGVHIALMPTAARVLDRVPHSPKGEHQMFYADPVAQEAYLDAMKEMLMKCGDIIHYIYFGDEFEEALISVAIYLWQNRRQEYPFIQEIQKEVLTRFGFKKYGIPEKSNYRWQGKYTEPYRWIAIRRWASDFTIRFARRVKEEAMKINPRILLVSPDPKAGNRAQYYESWRGIFDLATHQVYLKPIKEEMKFPGFVTKLIRDLSGIPHIWPCLHLESLGAYYSPDEVIECLSQTFVAGATGMHTWPIPTGRGSLTGIDLLDAPGRQDLFEQFGELVASGLRPKLPRDPDIALLYSNDACSAHADDYGIPQPVRAYEYLSEGCGANFRFVGDLGIELGLTNLREYKTLIVPVADIIRRPTAEKILKALKSGLKLVVLQPDAFSYHLDGSSMEGLTRRMRGGATLVELDSQRGTFVIPAESDFLAGPLPSRLYVVGQNFQYPYTDLSPYITRYTFANLPKHAEIILRYADGQPASFLTSVGRGRVLWLGFSPLLQAYEKGWEDFFRALLMKLGHNLDLPFWRLRLPLRFRRVNRGWIYLTGNAYHHECSIPQVTQNVYLPGSYRYSHAPDSEPDVADAGVDIPFKKGRLTNRSRSVGGGNTVSYKTGEEILLDFDLSTSCRVDRVDVYLSDYVPEVELLASDDRKRYLSVDRTSQLGDAEGVIRVVLRPPEPTPPHRYWRLSFRERPHGKFLTIVEIDFLQRANDAD